MAFYWHKGAKVELSKSTTYRCVRQSGNITPQNRQRIAAALDANSADELDLGKGMLLYKTNPRSPAQALPADTSELTVFDSPSGEPVVLSEKFTVQFKEEVTRQQIDALNTQNKVSIVRELKGRKNVFVLTAQKDAGADALTLANRYHDSGLALHAEPNFVQQLKLASGPNDPRFLQQWALKNTGQRGGIAGQDIRAVDAWSVRRGANITIAIIDAGVDYSHDEFQAPGKLVEGFDASDGIGTPGPTPSSNHGTACAGIAAAAANNGVGISGVAPESRIMGIKIGNMGPNNLQILWADSDDVAYGIQEAVDRKADVLSISWTYPVGLLPPAAVDVALDYASGNGRNVGGAVRGCVVCCAAGNNNGTPPAALPFPANRPDVIAVTACNQWGEFKTTTSRDGDPTWGSNSGPGVLVCAPGVQITTTFVNNGYTDNFFGTSAAAAHVAGVAALMLSLRQVLSATEVRDILRNTADNIGPAGNPQTGHGRVNAHRALHRVRLNLGSVFNRIDINNVLNTTQQLDSLDGRFALIVRSDGNLELTGPEGRRWASSTQGNPGAYVDFPLDGNFIVRNAAGEFWSSRTDGQGITYGELDNNGHFTLYRPGVGGMADVPVWSTRSMLSVGVRLTSANPLHFVDGSTSLTLEAGGNLVLRTLGVATPLWESGAAGNNAYAELQNGNLILFRADGTQFWASNTAGSGAVFVQVENGAFSLRTLNGTAVWSTRSILRLGGSLGAGQALVSPNGQVMLGMNFNGTLTLLAPNPWSSPNPISFGASARLLLTGDFAIVPAAGGAALWSSGTAGQNVAYLKVHNDGYFALYTSLGVEVWSTRAAPRPTSSLNLGDRLTSADQPLVSQDGRFTLVMQPNGNLEFRETAPGNRLLWASSTANNPGAYAELRAPGGNFVVCRADGTPLWASGTAGQGVASLQLENSPSFTLNTAGGAAVWSSRTMLSVGATLNPNEELVSLNGQFRLRMQPGGNLELLSMAGARLWSSETPNNPGAHAELLSGNFVVRVGANTRWESGTAGSNAVFVQVQNNGSVGLYMRDGQEVWVRPTPAASRLNVGEQLVAGQRLVSQNGQYILSMEANGNLEFRDAAGRLWWASASEGNPGAHAELLPGGNFVVRVGANTRWESRTSGSNAIAVQLDNNGHFALLTAIGNAVWSSRTMLSLNTRLNPNEELISLDGATRLRMQPNGNLELLSVAAGTTLWSSDTVGSPGAYAHFWSNGNLTVLSNTGTVLWTSVTDNQGAVFARLESGHLTFFARDNSRVWSTQSILRIGGRLTSDSPMFSPNGLNRLEMLIGGNLVLQVIGNPPKTLWLSATSGNSGAYAVLEASGDFVIYTTTGLVRWRSNTMGANYLAVLNNNTFVLRRNDGTLLQFYPPPGWP